MSLKILFQELGITRPPTTSKPPKEPKNHTAVAYQRVLSVSDRVGSFFKPSIFSRNYEHNFSALLETQPLPKGSDVWTIASRVSFRHFSTRLLIYSCNICIPVKSQ